MNKTTRVAIYCRVSSQEQALHGYSIDEQVRKLSAYCELKDWLVYDTYIDPGYTGSNINRPAVQKLIKDALSKKFDLVLIYKLDRLSRSQKDTMYLLEDVFIKNDIDLVALNESFDTSTPFGRAMIGILSVFAQLERENIKERTMMGRIARIRQGHNGGTRPPLGYKFKPGSNDLVVDPYEAMIVKEMYKLFLAGEPLGSIATLMSNKYGDLMRYWNNTSVKRLLINPVYTGKISYGSDLYDGIHEALIDEETYKKVLAITKRNEELRIHQCKQALQKSGLHLLTGLLYCPYCGARMSYTRISRSLKARYTCYSVNRNSKAMIKDENCINRAHPFSDKELEAIILGEIRKLAIDPDYLEKTISKATPEDTIEPIRLRLEDIESQIARLLDLYKLGFSDIDKISKDLRDLSDEKERLEDLIKTQEIIPTITPNEVKDHASTFADIVDNGSDEDKYKLIHTLIDRIEVLNDDIKIFWSFV